MKVTLLHGDHVVKSRERLIAIQRVIKTRGWEIERFDRKLSHPLSELIAQQSMFSKDKLYVIEGIANLVNSDFDWVKNRYESNDSNLLIWNKGVVGKGVLNKLPSSTVVESFNLPKLLYKFLDSLLPGNTRVAVVLFRQLTKTEAVQLVFAIMATTLRDLYWVKVDPDTLDYPMWRKDKLAGQATKLGKEKLRKAIGKLAEIDLKVKTSDTDLSVSLEMFIVWLLQ